MQDFVGQCLWSIMLFVGVMSLVFKRADKDGRMGKSLRGTALRGGWSLIKRIGK